MSEDQIDNSMQAASGGAIANATILGLPKERILPILLALSIGVNILCWWTIDQYKADVMLKIWDEKEWRGSEYAQTKAKVDLLMTQCKR